MCCWVLAYRRALLRSRCQSLFQAYQIGSGGARALITLLNPPAWHSTVAIRSAILQAKKLGEQRVCEQPPGTWQCASWDAFAEWQATVRQQMANAKAPKLTQAAASSSVHQQLLQQVDSSGQPSQSGRPGPTLAQAGTPVSVMCQGSDKMDVDGELPGVTQAQPGGESGSLRKAVGESISSSCIVM